MVWALILMVSWTNPAVTSVVGFTSEASCKAAGEAFVRDNGSAFRRGYMCIEVR